MVIGPDRRTVLISGAAALTMGCQKARTSPKIDLWNNSTGPHLRGAVFPQRRVYPEIDGDVFLGSGSVGAPITNQALDSLAAAGANFALLSHPGLFSETAPYRQDRAIEDHLADMVERCRQRGIFTVIGFRTGPGRSEFTFHRDSPGDWFPASMINERVWSDAEAQAAWAEMWRHAARQFRGHESVAGYLLMVEPNGSHIVRHSPWSGMARTLADAIRSVDAETPLLISPDGYAHLSGANGFSVPPASNTVLTVHDYEPFAYTHGDPMSAASFTPEQARLDAPVAGRWMLGEFGVRRWAHGAEQFLRYRMESLDSHGANSAFFHWETGWEPYDSQENAWIPHYGREQRALRPAADAPMLAVLQEFWSRNRARP
ncbi:glycoside hydrolase family 5 protein [Hyphobacterium sp.]|uniref:glycoside hydrolase family 5 protein n=1 Tax=Hyphobacterium sp. TaxID=2004662 RepID=UPI003BA97D18